ncbi:LPS assembly lipoprotein LptE [Thiomicrorhabdus xiamenensis]|uniref:LPS-assembly lipoprotein LptE n=1 Tax=Thiomicrorhabdus xiamenensis TaxID=2739063 RepID=A0A7D4SIF4_9GAMM|nr:LPS assembly lipoprotein LptE [Thiomicrorhabdus xiamenensis]QKI88559.1 hypothetical protein HQN79_02700 [Thiomicrorhabdus xiamenensis]
MQKMLKSWLLVLGTAFMVVQLGACSFQLRGSDGEVQFANAELKTILLQAEPDTDSAIKRELKNLMPPSVELETVQKLISTQSAQAINREIGLILGSTQKSAKRTSVSAIGETTAEFIRWSQPYQVRDASGKVLLTDNAFAYRDRQIDPQGVMAANQERYELEKQMAREIAEQIVRRLQYLQAK